jgi:hypothetical protein
MYGTIRIAAHWSEIELRLHTCYNSYTGATCTSSKWILHSLLHQHNSLKIPQGAFHTLYPVSKMRWISAAVRFTAESTGSVFRDNLITIISWGRLNGYNSVDRDTFLGLGIIYGYLPIYFMGLVNASGIRHYCSYLFSSLAGNNFCWWRKYNMGKRVDRAELRLVAYCEGPCYCTHNHRAT